MFPPKKDPKKKGKKGKKKFAKKGKAEMQAQALESNPFSKGGY